MFLVVLHLGEIIIGDIAGVNWLYMIFYFIPVAVGAALLGIRGGILTVLAAVLLARVYLFTDNKHGLSLASFPSIAETIEFGTLLLGAMTIAFVTGRLWSALGVLNQRSTDLQEANGLLTESERQQRVFSHDVPLAVTGGKLQSATFAPPPRGPRPMPSSPAMTA